MSLHHATGATECLVGHKPKLASGLQEGGKRRKPQDKIMGTLGALKAHYYKVGTKEWHYY